MLLGGFSLSFNKKANNPMDVIILILISHFSRALYLREVTDLYLILASKITIVLFKRQRPQMYWHISILSTYHRNYSQRKVSSIMFFKNNVRFWSQLLSFYQLQMYYLYQNLIGLDCFLLVQDWFYLLLFKNQSLLGTFIAKCFISHISPDLFF